MKVFLWIFFGIHGSLHFLGFLKAFGLKDINTLTFPISKTMGSLWLLGGVLILTFSTLHFFAIKNSWTIGILALIISQCLIFVFWEDAKWGSLPNIILLFTVAFAMGNSFFGSKIARERSEILAATISDEVEVFSEEEIKNLPKPVKNWHLASGAIGKPKARNGKLNQVAQMKMKPNQKDWFEAKALQYTVVDPPSFNWAVDLKMNPIMWIEGRDSFKAGKGEMLIKLNSLINIVNASGLRIDEGALQRFLGEMVWFPSLAISPFVSWEELDELSAKATMEFQNTRGSGTFYFNEAGDFVKFIALRFQGDDPNAARKEWIMTVEEYAFFEGIKVPSKMKATWNLEQGEWNWLKLEVKNLEYNQPFTSQIDN
ncbi:MAG: hypothetical protein P8O16_12855 [Algoriphagus sp.]|uniref:DUF6544 family protein n=1 Tax=Algoriphagus sp. TaxID=1872435 RepID=UPI00260A7D87|nr:DUF6544 family protein [Algoriphagus sp.]MDG1278164.1 hypothetical protein [Algoriphagus sp.]